MTDGIHKYKNIHFLSIEKHRVKDYVSQEELDSILEILFARVPGKLLMRTYELGKKYRQLHMHCIVAMSRPFKYKENSSIGGFRLYFKRVYDMEGVLRYMRKDATNDIAQCNILTQNYIRHNYAFIPPERSEGTGGPIEV